MQTPTSLTIDEIIRIANRVGMEGNINYLQAFADALLDHAQHQHSINFTEFWTRTINELESVEPPVNSSFDYYMGFMEAKRLALRTVKQLD